MFFTILKSKNVDFKGSFICGSRVSGGDPKIGALEDAYIAWFPRKRG